ncbi:myeloid leukemia factor-like isoform X3 [Dinothrombium tinctorium]|uniref:Myeloid leukemia factor-like isoform X3 n=1 Tax=Dinothrombium tinctorium TaxID=1965070 RepID=A0A3S4QDF3_9ACAR|nr:myeloid leukemia factor-like isoform X3 [Dinothrombium tinctorium]
MALMGFGDFDDMFGRVDRMMNSMMRNMFGSMNSAYDLMDDMLMPFHSRQPMGHSTFDQFMLGATPANSSYSYSSSVMTMSTDRYGRPQVYEETHSTRCAPGGVKETHSSVRDSASGYQKMSLGHHIEDRAHIMQRSRNYYTGEEEHNNEYVNIDEEDAASFNREWNERIGRYNPHHEQRQLPSIPQRERSNSPQYVPLPLPAPEASTSSSQAVESPSHSRNKISHKHKSKRSKKPYRKN